MLVVACVILLAAITVSAQIPPAFEVASVRPNTSGDRRSSIRWTPGGDVEASNQVLRTLIVLAFRKNRFQMEGGPDWIDMERFDIAAKAPAGLTMEPLAEMRSRLMRALLEDRFKLKARLVTKEMPAMVLMSAKSDGSLGPQIRKSEVDCDSIAAARGRGAGAPPAVLPRPARPVCALGGGSAGPICGGAVTMTQLAAALSGVFQREVIDRTDLQGRFDFDLTFTPDNPGGPGIAFGNACGELNADRPAFSTAMQEQLGLKLESQRAPVEVLVIDSVERPTEN